MSGYQTGPGNEITTDGTWNYKFDPAGNLIEKDGISNGLTWKYTYDNRNQLIVAAEYSGGTLQYQISYSHDPFGNLVEQDETQSGTTTVTKFLNDEYGNAIADLNSSNAVQFMRVFLNMADSEIERIYSDGTEYGYLANHLGSVTGLMNNSGTLADAITYDAFGNPSETAPSIGDRYKLDGGGYNSTTGMSHFGAREYGAAFGSWTTPDPASFGAGDRNLYRMVGNDPVNATDPSGLCSASLAPPQVIAVATGASMKIVAGFAGAGGTILVIYLGNGWATNNGVRVWVGQTATGRITISLAEASQGTAGAAGAGGNAAAAAEAAAAAAAAATAAEAARQQQTAEWEAAVEALREKIATLTEEIESKLADDFGYGRHRVTGSEGYLDQLMKELADLVAKGPRVGN